MKCTTPQPCNTHTHTRKKKAIIVSFDNRCLISQSRTSTMSAKNISFYFCWSWKPVMLPGTWQPTRQYLTNILSQNYSIGSDWACVLCGCSIPNGWVSRVDSSCLTQSMCGCVGWSGKRIALHPILLDALQTKSLSQNLTFVIEISWVRSR